MTSWFAGRARSLDLTISLDDAGNSWAWWVPVASSTGQICDISPAIAVGGFPIGGHPGSPARSLPFAAIEELRAAGFTPSRPIGVTEFSHDRAVSFQSDYPIAAFIDVVDAPGRLLAGAGHEDPGHPIGIGTQIWPRGRWRVELTGVAGAAGVVRLDDRQDPIQDAARLILAAREMAYRYSALATTSRIVTEPNDPAVIPSRIQLWLDACAPSDVDLLDLVQEFVRTAAESGAKIIEESWASSTTLDAELARRIAQILTESLGSTGSIGSPPLPVVASGATSSAGFAAAAGIPAALIYLRDAEATAANDQATGIHALAAVLAELASQPVG